MYVLYKQTASQQTALNKSFSEIIHNGKLYNLKPMTRFALRWDKIVWSFVWTLKCTLHNIKPSFKMYMYGNLYLADKSIRNMSNIIRSLSPLNLDFISLYILRVSYAKMAELKNILLSPEDPERQFSFQFSLFAQLPAVLWNRDKQCCRTMFVQDRVSTCNVTV